jgi:hypothetical protein
MMNRRNAVLGWIVWEAGKLVLKKKAVAAVPSFDMESRRPNRSAMIVAGAFLVGLLWFWFRDGGDEGPLS